MVHFWAIFVPVSSKTTLATYSLKATLDSRLWHGPADAVGLPGHGVGDPADAVGHLVKDYGLHAAHAGSVRHDPHDHPTSVLVLDLQGPAAVAGACGCLCADAAGADLVLVVEEAGHLKALPVRHHRHRRRLQHVRVRRALVPPDPTPPDDRAEGARLEVEVAGLGEAGGGHVGRQLHVPVQVQHGDVEPGLGLDLALVEAHDVLVERVPDDVRGEVGVRR